MEFEKLKTMKGLNYILDVYILEKEKKKERYFILKSEIRNKKTIQLYQQISKVSNISQTEKGKYLINQFKQEI